MKFNFRVRKQIFFSTPYVNKPLFYPPCLGNDKRIFADFNQSIFKKYFKKYFQYLVVRNIGVCANDTSIADTSGGIGMLTLHFQVLGSSGKRPLLQTLINYGK